MKMKISNLMLVIVIIAVTIFAAGAFLLQYFANMEISPTLTTCWFAFWGTEIVSLAAIKTSKVKHGKDDKDPPKETYSDDEDMS